MLLISNLSLTLLEVTLTNQDIEQEKKVTKQTVHEERDNSTQSSSKYYYKVIYPKL